jgi:hypothetical protein
MRSSSFWCTAMPFSSRAFHSRVIRHCALALPAMLATQAAVALTPLGSVPLPAPATAARMSADGTRVIVQMPGARDAPAALQLIDATDAMHPVLKGAVAVPPDAEMALSGDGRSALLAAAHEIVAIDLSDPAGLRVSWRQALPVRYAALSSQADAYAFSRRSTAAAGSWEVVVVSAGDRQARVLPANGNVGGGRLALSPHGEFIALVEGALRVWDLRAAAPVEFRQAWALHRFDPCALAVLADGSVVMQDTRVSRLAVYAAAPDMPRIATLSHADTLRCGALDPNSNDGTLAFSGGQGRVQRVGLGRPAAPVARGTWPLPPGVGALAAAGDLVVAAGTHPPRLQWFRLDDDKKPPSVDWRALEAAHAAALAAYKPAAPGPAGGSLWAAVRRLEEAGVLLALDAPVAQITPRRAAAIFNDYGFLAAKTGVPPSPQVEAALRRAIALDPGRAVAHLNLADVLRKGLAQLAAAKERAARLKDIERHYRAYLAAGGPQTDAITAFLRGTSIAQREEDSCQAMASLANAGVLADWVSDRGIGIPWKGRRIDVLVTLEGTAGVPYLQAFDAGNDRLLADDDAPQPPDSSYWGGDQVGLLTLRGRHHLLHYRDFAHPVASLSLDGSESCAFTVDTSEYIGPAATEPELCRALQEGTVDADLPFDGPVAISGAAVREKWRETSAGGTRMMDLLGNGHPVNVVELFMASGAGAGCDAAFYDLLVIDGDRFEGGQSLTLLSQLQGGDGIAAAHPFSMCRNRPRFFDHGGRIYYETKPKTWPPRDQRDQYHRVVRFGAGRLQEVCDFRFKSVVSGQR